MVELIGYAASLFIAVSLLMVSLMRLRILNLIGCGFFVVYGVIIGAWPIVVTNSFISVVNIVFLYKMFRQNISHFSYVEMNSAQGDTVLQLVQDKMDDIQKFYPLFHSKMIAYAFQGHGKVFGAFRVQRLQGISILLELESLLPSPPPFWGDQVESDPLEPIILELCRKYPGPSTYLMPADYLVPKYRDLGVVGKFHQRLLADLPFLIERICCPVQRKDKGTRRYFQRNGYEKVLSLGDVTIFELDLRDLRAGLS
ncbi:MAG: YgjV family protein [Spirochaetales bacterium]|nr:YgjV family protein [Spirochaetales bacterium]